MNMNQVLRSAILPIVPVCEPKTYRGAATEYCVFDYDLIPGNYADGAPTTISIVTQLNWFLPLGVNPLDKMMQISQALQTAGMPCPNISDYSDENYQHYVFEFTHLDYASEVVSNA